MRRALPLPGFRDRWKLPSSEVFGSGSLNAAGWTLIAFGVVSLVMRLPGEDGLRAPGQMLFEFGAQAGLGLLALIAQRVPALQQRPKLVWAGLVLAASVAVLVSTFGFASPADVYHYGPGELALVIVAAAALSPFEPKHVGAIGVVVTLMQYATARWMRDAERLATSDYDLFQASSLLMNVCLAVVISEVLRRGRASERMLLENVMEGRMRSLLSEGSASFSRFAAAMSHELNSPLGVIRSSADTLACLDGRGERGEMREELLSAIRKSCGRMHEAIVLMQRYTQLDRAEVGWVDMAEVVADVLALQRGTHPGIRIAVEGESHWGLMGRRGHLSTMLHAVLGKAVESSIGSVLVCVSERGVVVQTDGAMVQEASRVEIDPAFAERGSRISTANWDLFAARQIARQHGGELTVFATRQGAFTQAQIELRLEPKAEPCSAGD
ncbi:MAG: HAMP domain-containing histidine kinase [Bryobacterales bacterium]|nr:HAMP domain-containing histidine kinase [Bryobacterales bacterium]